MKRHWRAVSLLAAALVSLAGCSGIGGPVKGDRDTALSFDKDYLAVYRIVADAVRQCHPEWATTARSFSDIRAAYVTSKATANAAEKDPALLRVDIASAGQKRTNVNIYAANARNAQSEASLIKAWVDAGSRSCEFPS